MHRTILTLALLWSPAQAATLTVTTTTDEVTTNGQCSLREAVLAANLNTLVDDCGTGDPLATAVDEIVIPAGTYTLTITGSDETWKAGSSTDPYEVDDQPDASIGDLDLLESVNIVGAGSGTVSVVWGSNEDRIFHVAATGADDVTADISGVTVSGGHVPTEVINPNDPPDQQWSLRRLGGGIAVGPGASVKLAGTSGSDEGNSGPPDVHVSGGDPSLVLSDVVIDANNSDGDGGGLFSGGALTATDVVISNNTCGGNGGGLYHEGTLALTAVQLLDNEAEGGGAAFFTGGTTGSITNSLVRGNAAVGGAGLSARALVILDVIGTTIAENAAGDVGGGLYTNGSFHLESCTVVDNTAGGDASFSSGGLSTFGGGLYELENTLLARNVAGETAVTVNCGCTGGGCAVGDYFTSHGFNLEDQDDCGLDQTSDLVDTDPKIRAIGDYGGPFVTYALLADSPAIDAGAATCPATDARGATRPLDGTGDGTATCDIGAVEFSPDEVDGDSDGYCVGLDLGGTLVCADGTTTGDCDDDEAASYPGNAEVCDGLDNDCANGVDDGLTFEDWYEDADSDTYGDPDSTVSTCDGAPTGYVADNTDCDDSADAVHPGATEICNDGIDDDCNDLADDDDEDVDLTTGSTFYMDGDGDGYGDAAMSVDACEAPTDYVDDATDCDDSDAAVHPGADEVKNDIDDDCDGLIDKDDDSYVKEGCGCSAAGPTSLPTGMMVGLVALGMIRRRRQ